MCLPQASDNIRDKTSVCHLLLGKQGTHVLQIRGSGLIKAGSPVSQTVDCFLASYFIVMALGLLPVVVMIACPLFYGEGRTAGGGGEG